MSKIVIEEIVKKRIIGYGNSSHIILSKKHQNKNAYVIVTSSSIEIDFQRLTDAMEKLEGRLDYIDKNVVKAGDEFETIDAKKNDKGELVYGKRHKLTDKEKRALVEN